MKAWTTLAVLFLAGTSAAAQNDRRPQLTQIVCNEHGAEVTLEGFQRFYIGKNCDVIWPGRGQGRWWSAASDLIVEIDGEMQRISSDVPCEALPYCQFSR
ncbi:MAG: hypothetical protein AAGI70_06335 [Pseudomonadota bacterium]